MMAGQRKRRNREALMSRSLMSGRPRLLHSCRHEANTSFSSRGKTLEGQRKVGQSSGRGLGQEGAEQGPGAGSDGALDSNTSTVMACELLSTGLQHGSEGKGRAWPREQGHGTPGKAVGSLQRGREGMGAGTQEPGLGLIPTRLDGNGQLLGLPRGSTLCPRHQARDLGESEENTTGTDHCPLDAITGC